ncbi:MAG: hypothetical protein M1829_005592 [Trizodia sp. TS-e1964]|nr:MAG: hypothetical protein M1829_005592 [Trizodia sp. TS-e1964]
MATPAPNPDTQINIKITFNGHNRRFKLPLRDLGANVLPDKLRLILAIPAERQVVFERYSDSAGAFITLDSNNPAVYKQLYRAAKAKLKLRLKATITSASFSASSSDSASAAQLPAPAERRYSAAIAGTSDIAMATEHLLALRYCQQQNLKASAAAQQAASPPEQESLLQGMNCRRACSLAKDSVWAQSILEAAPTTDILSTALPASPASPPMPAGRVRYMAELASRIELASRTDATQARQMALRPKKDGHSPLAAPELCQSWSVYCNTCDAPIPDAHYHCSICDGGDFDLCQSCVNNGMLCGGEEHWMIKRFVANGKFFNSTTETIGPKRTEKKDAPIEKASTNTFTVPAQEDIAVERGEKTRTCNSCVEGRALSPPAYPRSYSSIPPVVYGEDNFVTCTTCDDYDLCLRCHMGQKHGHSPSHAFHPASDNVSLNAEGKALCAPGRNVAHQAMCDGCEKYIYGIRHKCLSCPDFDYCTTCEQGASETHPHHQFVKIYEPMRAQFNVMRHLGIYCDGPLCKNKSAQSYILGTRYKCAVCHDLDFCANCEASPQNHHNISHPLIKFKTAIRSVTVTTVSDKGNGNETVTLGDLPPRRKFTSAKPKQTAASTNSATPVQTVAEMKPSEPAVAEAPKSVTSKMLPTYQEVPELQAHFVRDLVADGTTLPYNHVFRQTWILRNPGPGAWPAGCSVKYVGGDNMLCLSPTHPSSLVAVGNAAESNVLRHPVAAGSEALFTVRMITPKREGKCISYWRLTAPDGTKFGNKLWCDVDITANAEGLPTFEHIEHAAKPTSSEPAPKAEESVMIFPKLDKESPVSSQAELVPQPLATAQADEALAQTGDDEDEQESLFSEADIESVQLDDETESGFLTDDEYDILNASDEEFLVEAQKSVLKK